MAATTEFVPYTCIMFTVNLQCILILMKTIFNSLFLLSTSYNSCKRVYALDCTFGQNCGVSDVNNIVKSVDMIGR